MNVLMIFSDESVANEHTDVFKRHVDYSSILGDGKLYIQYFSKEKKNFKNKGINFFSLKNKNLIYIIINLRLFILDNNIDLIVCPTPFYPGLVSMVLKYITKRKFLISIYGSNIFVNSWYKESILFFIYRFTLAKLVFRSADYFQTDSTSDLLYLKEKFKNKMVFYKPMIPNNIDDFLKQREVNHDRRYNVLYIGRLVKQKNIKFLKNIVIDILNLNKNISFTIIGDGPEFTEIESLIQNNNRILWYSHADRNQILNLYHSADVLLLCSNYEGFPRVFMEAAASGIPIITTNVSGSEEVVKDGETGYILYNHGDFVRSILKLESNRSLSCEMGLKSQKYFFKKFNYRLTIELQKKLFEYVESDIIGK